MLKNVICSLPRSISQLTVSKKLNVKLVKSSCVNHACICLCLGRGSRRDRVNFIRRILLRISRLLTLIVHQLCYQMNFNRLNFPKQTCSAGRPKFLVLFCFLKFKHT